MIFPIRGVSGDHRGFRDRVRWDKTGDTYTIFDSLSGQMRAKVVKTAPGNAEKLAP
jgi:hypothetical protein